MKENIEDCIIKGLLQQWEDSVVDKTDRAGVYQPCYFHLLENEYSNMIFDYMNFNNFKELRLVPNIFNDGYLYTFISCEGLEFNKEFVLKSSCSNKEDYIGDFVAPLTVEGNVCPLTVEGNVVPLIVDVKKYKKDCDVKNNCNGLFKANDYDENFLRMMEVGAQNTDKTFFKTEPIEEKKDLVQEEEKFSKTEEEYIEVMNQCREIFCAKLDEYGPGWRIIRPESATDQIFIRYSRISKMYETPEFDRSQFFTEFQGIVNYAIIGLIQMMLGNSTGYNYLQGSEKLNLIEHFDSIAQTAYDTMKSRNSEFCESWRLMRMCSFIDFIGMKVLRIKELERDCSKSDKSKIQDIYFDIINYSIFALIRLSK